MGSPLHLQLGKVTSVWPGWLEMLSWGLPLRTQKQALLLPTPFQKAQEKRIPCWGGARETLLQGSSLKTYSTWKGRRLQSSLNKMLTKYNRRAHESCQTLAIASPPTPNSLSKKPPTLNCWPNGQQRWVSGSPNKAALLASSPVCAASLLLCCCPTEVLLSHLSPV